MRVFLYEFVTGGGLLGLSTGEIERSLLIEGTAMRDALAEDFAVIANCNVDVLVDPRIAPPRVRSVTLYTASKINEHDEIFDRCAAAADWTLIVAPELGGNLERLARRVLQVGGRLLGPSPEVIALAANKHRLAEHLRKHGIRAPQGVLLKVDQPLPETFRYPAVLKPMDGCGSLGVQRVERHDASCVRDPALATEWRLEEFCRGIPVSVALLCGPAATYPLPACRQALSDEGRFKYLGGSFPIGDTNARERLERLAQQAVETLGAVSGYVGVDLVMSPEGSGEGDAVIEINPRLTTSYTGLRAAARCNLAQGMIDAACGRTPSLSFAADSIRFNAAGEISRGPTLEKLQ